MHALYSDEACTTFTMRRALTEGESRRTVASIAGHWLLRGYGPYAVEEKVIGHGAWNCWALVSKRRPEPEIK